MSKTAWIVVGWLALPGLACGASESDAGDTSISGSAGVGAAGGGGTGGGAAGSSSAGTAAGGSGASGGVSPLGDSAAEACIAYALAVCQRQSECRGGSGDECLQATLSCPDLTASPGSTRTVEGLKACAETYATLPCDQVEAYVLPPCVTPGERAQGEPCVFASQCSTLSCKYDAAAECGKCAVEVAIGESCAADDVDCAAGSTCQDGLCAALTSPPELDPPAGPNEPCSPVIGCVEDYYCPDGTESPVCTASPVAGEACVPLTICASDAYCVENELDQRVCAPSPGLGEPCASALDSPIAEPYICEPDLLCSYTSPTEGTCLPWPQSGEPCNIPPSNPSYGRCALGLSCNFAASPPVCGLAKAGEPCESSSNCEANLWCGCPESAPECDSTVCVTLKLGGEPCGADAASNCHPAFDCIAGTCQPAEPRGTFAEACGG